ncbi:hypothetical protein PCPL58_3687 [Pseudomonas cerasi]|uniref:Uncharacterized protein n=1 Tax=Pseudomonas cerasi TaxID=1583341 RepID=A0A193STI8_9PSED|nr:hypothetical protein PCPL58_3687 [Pseudomonas cerasi]SOS21864.1 hypothetical protein PL963_03777 [Pseudomonas cerasi]
MSREPLVIFIPGTDGRSETAPDLMLRTVAQQGYRVIYLTYNNAPAVSNLCPSRPAGCSGRFRESRVFGGSGPPVATPGIQVATIATTAATAESTSPPGMTAQASLPCSNEPSKPATQATNDNRK